MRGDVDVVLPEARDRFSPHREDAAGLFKRLTFAAVGIVTLSEGDNITSSTSARASAG